VACVAAAAVGDASSSLGRGSCGGERTQSQGAIVGEGDLGPRGPQGVASLADRAFSAGMGKNTLMASGDATGESSQKPGTALARNGSYALVPAMGLLSHCDNASEPRLLARST
jgi:hypothetical protein